MIGRHRRKTANKTPAPSAREVAITQTAWNVIESASVMLRTVDDQEGARAIVHTGGRNAWAHSQDETAARLDRMFPGLPAGERNRIIRHIDARIAEQISHSTTASRGRAITRFANRWTDGFQDTPFADRGL